MEIHFILLIAITIIKGIVLLGLTQTMYKKWKQQRKRYFNDFPFLMALTFLIYAIVKFFDIFIYNYGENPLMNVSTENSIWEIIKNVRFVLSPVFTMGILTYLLTIIWFGGNRRIQILIGICWVLGAILCLILIKDLELFYKIIAIFTAPVMILSMITFLITHHQKKLPEINSLLLAIGYISLTIAQLMRELWLNFGSGNFGLSWIGELIELFCLIIIAIGFLIPASYSNLGEKSEKIQEDFLKNVKDHDSIKESSIEEQVLTNAKEVSFV